MPRLHPLFTPQDIKVAVERIAEEISRDYQNKSPLLIGILKGSFVFMADLIRNLDIPLELDFVTLSSYRQSTGSSGQIDVIRDLSINIKDRHVLIIEDIIDTGLTMSYLFENLQRRRPASLKLCALFDKSSCHQVPNPIDYVGLSVPDFYIVGYGLDYNEEYRHLPGLYYLEDEN